MKKLTRKLKEYATETHVRLKLQTVPHRTATASISILTVMLTVRRLTAERARALTSYSVQVSLSPVLKIRLSATTSATTLMSMLHSPRTITQKSSQEKKLYSSAYFTALNSAKNPSLTTNLQRMFRNLTLSLNIKPI